MEEPGENTPGVLASLGRLLKTALAIAQNRLELLLVEVQEARWRFFDALLLTGVVLILALMTLMTATVTIVVVCVQAERLDVVVALALLYLAGTIFAFWRLHARLKNWALFSTTRAELKKDKTCLHEKN
jgi:uncharacterized membrane protein YqjE